MMAELMAFLVIFDTLFYYCHRLLHTRNFYKCLCYLLALKGVLYAIMRHNRFSTFFLRTLERPKMNRRNVVC